MKPLIEVYPMDSYGYLSVGDYRPLLQSMGYEIVVQVDESDYQGDSLVLFKDGDRYGYLSFGWGSCTGCDALQACGSYADIEELRQKLHSDIRWYESAEELLTFIRVHDWEGDWTATYLTREFTMGVEKALS